MQLNNKFIIKLLLLTGLVTFLANCRINNVNIPGGFSNTPVNVNLGGVVNGLGASESVTLQNNNSDTQTVTGSGTGIDSFTFPTKLSTGEGYYVTVLSQPLTKVCIVGGNVGTVGSTDILSLQVTCSPLAAPPTYVVGGIVSNLLGSGLVLRMNGTENLAVNGSGPFAFSSTLLDGELYDVIIAAQPSAPSQTCIITGSTGAINAADVTTISVNCVTNQYSVAVSVSGLNPGDSVTLQNNGGSNLTITEPVVTGVFPPQDDGMSYLVSVFTQPAGGFCWVNNATGLLSGSAPNISVVCSYGGATFTVGGTVSGLNGGTLVLKNSSNNENLPITVNGIFAFTTTFPDLAAYSVSVQANPTSPDQSCTVSGGDNALGGGNIASVNVTSILVNCSTNSYSVGGNVTFAGTGSVTLLNNGSDAVTVVSPSTPFTFPGLIASGSTYNVTISATTGGISCNVSNGIGVVGSGNVTGIAVSCGAPSTYAIGGTITGLPVPVGGSSGVTLQNNGGDNIILTTNGNFSFPSLLLNGDSYSVTVLTQPTNPGEICTVLNSSGTVSSAAVTSIVVTCSINTYTVSGTVSGLASGEQVVVQNNGAGDQTVIFPATNFNFPAQNDGTSFIVTVLSSSPTKICTPGANTGIINAGNISTITITCNAAPLYAVNLTVSGWPGIDSTDLILVNNGSDYVSITMNGIYSFPTVLADGAAYSVGIVQQPTSPNRTCNFTSGFSGIISGAAASITLNCPLNQYSIGGTVAGLANGEIVVLQNNGGDNRSVSGTGSPFRAFTFATQMNDFSSYNVTVLTNPPGKTCTAGANTGTVNGASITSVVIDCAVTPMYTVGGAISGLAGGSVTLQNNTGDNLSVTANGVFNFATALNNAATYSVTVLTQPTSPNQTCTVTSGGSGTISAANVTSVNINCVTLQYTVGGTISGMNGGDSITLLNNGTTPVTRNANGGFTFPAQNDATAYNVTIQTMPATTSCTVGAGSGVLSGASINPVTVNCSAAGTFSIGGSVSGLTGNSVTLIVNGGVSTAVRNVIGAYTFPATFTNGFVYSVSVSVNPTGPNQTCTVSNPSGTIAGAGIGNVNVSCATNTYTIAGAVAGLVGLDELPIKINGGMAVLPTASIPSFTSAPINDGSANVPLQILGGPADKSCTFNSNLSTSRTVTIAGANVTGVNVTCALVTTASVSVTVVGLTGAGFTLINYVSPLVSDPYSENKGIGVNGTYAFLAQPEGSDYTVVVLTQPTGQLCGFTGGNSGTMAIPAAPVSLNISCIDVPAVCGNTTIEVGEQCDDGNTAGGDGCSNTCQTEFLRTVGGNIFGLGNLDNITLKNGTETLPLTGNGANPYPFTFTTSRYDGEQYNVTISSNPATKICNVDLSTSSGTINGSNITNIVVNCIPQSTYSVSGTVRGLGSKSVTINLNGGTGITVNGGGTNIDAYAPFSNVLADGVMANVSITTQPSGGPVTTCTGVSVLVQSANIVNADVICSTSSSAPADQYENDDTIATAKAHGVNSGFFSHTFDAGVDEDYVSINVVNTNLVYTITTFDSTGSTCAAPMDTVIGLYHTDQLTLLASDDESGVLSCSKLVYQFTVPGTYYLRIFEGVGTITPYKLAINTEVLLFAEHFDNPTTQFTANILAANTAGAPKNNWFGYPNPGNSSYRDYSLYDASGGSTPWSWFTDGNYIVIDSDWAGVGTVVEAELVAPDINCANYSLVRLEFNSMWKNISGIFKVQIRSTASGQVWQDVLPGPVANMNDSYSFDISAQAAGNADVQIRFYYYGAYDWFATLDNVYMIAQ